MIAAHPHPLALVRADFSADRMRRFALFALASAIFLAGSRVAAQQANTPPVLYSQGDPTNNEQYLLQLLNRARLDPVGEGQRMATWLRNTADGQAVIRYYILDPDQVASAIAAFPAVPPLALDPNLLLAARQHATDMAVHNYQDHTGTDGSTPPSRVAATHYNGFCFEENVALSQTSLDSIHAGYFVDWGVPDLGHRTNSLSGDKCLNAVGIGLTTVPANASLAETEDYGAPPLSITHGILSSLDAPAMLTGVAYHDANGNGQYDPGEGAAGATVTMDGGAYYAVTSASGGYALPLVNADGTSVDGPATVHVALPGSTDLHTSTVTVSNYTGPTSSYRANVEWDIVSNDPPVAINATKPSVSGGGTVAKGGKLKLVVTRPANSDLSQPLTVAYTLKGTAAVNVDYAPLPSTVTISAGKATAKIKITALNETVLNRPPGAVTLVIKLKGVARAQGKATVTFMP